MDTFFGITVPAGTISSTILALLLAVLLGGLIGLERELHAHPAGLRTHILVCVGATLMTLISVRLASDFSGRADPGRIAAQIVAGIGFLGAGAIIREGATIRGLTTAASIWTTAGIGIAIGAGPRYGEMAVLTTAIVLFTLWILNWVEDWINLKSRRNEFLEVYVRDTNRAVATVLARVADHNIRVRSMQFEAGKEPNTRHILLRVGLPDRLDRAAFLASLADEQDILSARLE